MHAFASHKMGIKYRGQEDSAASGVAVLSSGVSAASGVTPVTDLSGVKLGKPQADEKTKIAVASLRKTHSQWGRSKREINGLVAQSEENHNTQGSKIERDLHKLVEDCTSMDDELVNLEQVSIVKGRLDDDQVKEVAELCARIKSATDAGREKGQALKAWFKWS